jgi:hypothetical protein
VAVAAVELRLRTEWGQLARRIAADRGFGIVELLIALMVLNIGVFATFAAFNAGALTLRRASHVATASAMADKQMELYRSLLYANLVLATPSTPLDATYTSDTAATGSLPMVSACPAENPPEACQATRLATGPDGKSYRIDTYMRSGVVAETASSIYPSRVVKVVTVVVRDPANLHSLVRTESTFDRVTGI